jgi:hypothetical protein
MSKHNFLKGKCPSDTAKRSPIGSFMVGKSAASLTQSLNLKTLQNSLMRHETMQVWIQAQKIKSLQTKD